MGRKTGYANPKKPHFLEEKGVILTRLGNFFRSLCMTNILKIRPFYYLKWCTVSLSCHSIKAFSEGDGHEPPILPSRLEAPQDRQDNVFILFYVMFVYYIVV